MLARVAPLLSKRPLVDVVEQLERRSSWPADRLSVLTYHRVDVPDDPDGRYPGLVSATPDEFRTQLEFVAASCHVVSIERVLRAARDGDPLPSRAVLLTFDDAVDDFERNVLPELRRHGFPAVVFVPTDFVGNDAGVFWWDAAHAAVTLTAVRDDVVTDAGVLRLGTERGRTDAYRSIRSHGLATTTSAALEFALGLCARLGVEPPRASVMDWDTLRSLGDDGVDCCAHTRSHAHLDHVDEEAVRAEVEGSVQALQAALGRSLPVFAYPAGRISPAVKRIVADAGVEMAFTTARGANRLWGCDRLAMRRTNVSRRTGLGAIRAQMLPVADRLMGT